MTGSNVLLSILVGVSRYSLRDAALSQLLWTIFVSIGVAGGIRGRGPSSSVGPSRLLWTNLLYVGGMNSFDPILAWSFLLLVLVRRILGHRRLERVFGLEHVAAGRMFELRALLLSPTGFR